jgi:hypothetical protein
MFDLSVLFDENPSNRGYQIIALFKIFLPIRRTDLMSEAVTQSNPDRLPTPEELGFDPGLLREKYAAERAKRLRADGNRQYQETTGQFAH